MSLECPSCHRPVSWAISTAKHAAKRLAPSADPAGPPAHEIAMNEPPLPSLHVEEIVSPVLRSTALRSSSRWRQTVRTSTNMPRSYGSV